jgi:hypothetical protein
MQGARYIVHGTLHFIPFQSPLSAGRVRDIPGCRSNAKPSVVDIRSTKQSRAVTFRKLVAECSGVESQIIPNQIHDSFQKGGSSGHYPDLLTTTVRHVPESG